MEILELKNTVTKIKNSLDGFQQKNKDNRGKRLVSVHLKDRLTEII